MPGFFEGIADDLIPIVKAALQETEDFLQSGGHDNLMRRFQRLYDTLSIEDIAEIQMALGHVDDEDSPCRVCRIMATKEVQLDQEV